MRRSLYQWLLRLHPRQFRVRHGAEMQDIFDSSDPGTRGWLLRDAAGSLVRQWALRGQRQEPALAPSEGAPRFHLMAEDRPASSAVVHGALVTLALWLALAGLMTYGASRRLSPGALRGSGRGNPQIAVTEHSGERTAPEGPALFFGDPLFQALDANSDGVLERQEAMLARFLLHTLDRNRDGVVTAGECGIRLPALQRWLGASVFQLVDRNSDGVIEGVEKWAAPRLLLAADADGDDQITPEEIRSYRR